MGFEITERDDDKGSELGDEIFALVRHHPAAVTVDALSKVVGLLCVTGFGSESRVNLTDFVSLADKKREHLEKLFPFGKARTAD